MHTFDHKMKQEWKEKAGAENRSRPHICLSHSPNPCIFCFLFIQSLPHISTNFWLLELWATDIIYWLPSRQMKI